MLKWLSCKHAAYLATLALIAVGSVQGEEATKPAILVGKPAKTFSTAEHPKSNGVALTISYPADWSTEEASQTLVVQRFASPTSSAVLSIGTSKTKRPPTKDEAVKLVADREGVSAVLPRSTKITDFQRTKVGEVSAALVECTDTRVQEGSAVYFHGFFLVFLQGDTLLLIQCRVKGSPADTAAVDEDFESHRELFKQILGSVKLAEGPK